MGALKMWCIHIHFSLSLLPNVSLQLLPEARAQRMLQAVSRKAMFK
jgi:hypothetical protein